MPVIVLGSFHIIIQLIFTILWGRDSNYSHFTDEETEIQRGEITLTGWGFIPRQFDPALTSTEIIYRALKYQALCRPHECTPTGSFQLVRGQTQDINQSPWQVPDANKGVLSHSTGYEAKEQPHTQSWWRRCRSKNSSLLKGLKGKERKGRSIPERPNTGNKAWGQP